MPEPRDAQRTATALLDAGAELADTHGLATLTVDAVVERAGTGKGTFYRHFASQQAYLIALHAHFVGRLAAAVGAGLEPHPPGAERLRAIAIGYLDACLGQRGLKAFLTEARVLPGVADSVETALAAYATVAAESYAAMGWPQPAAAGRLFVAMAHETALAEQRRGRRQPALREALLHMSGAQPR